MVTTPKRLAKALGKGRLHNWKGLLAKKALQPPLLSLPAKAVRYEVRMLLVFMKE